MNTPYDYTLKEWMDHSLYFAELSLREQSTDGPELARLYFGKQYSDPREATYKLARFVAAETYLDQHWEDLEAAGLALVSSKTAWNSRHIAYAMFRFYSHAPDETLLGEPPSAAFMIRLIRESETAERDRKRALQ